MGEGTGLVGTRVVSGMGNGVKLEREACRTKL